jgi:hypothetical protein
MKAIRNWLNRWRLRRIVRALEYATDYGLKKEVRDFAAAMEATLTMAAGAKTNDELLIQCTKQELGCFITYMARLHTSKESLLLRARIGLATLACKDSGVLGEDPLDFYKRELGKARRSKDDKRIQLLK